LASLSGALYVGLTDDLQKRIWEHKHGTFDGFTKKYAVDRLMYFEVFTDAAAAASREKQIKAYRREKKIALFEASNPSWRDLSNELLVSL
jgi:putative endonuclease